MSTAVQLVDTLLGSRRCHDRPELETVRPKFPLVWWRVGALSWGFALWWGCCT